MSRRARLFSGAHGRIPPEIADDQLGDGVSLADLGTGLSARVVEIRGDAALSGRMKAIGIVPGAVITKRSAIPAHGPIVVEKGPMQLAMSHDMSRSILVEPANRRR